MRAHGGGITIDSSWDAYFSSIDAGDRDEEERLCEEIQKRLHRICKLDCRVRGRKPPAYREAYARMYTILCDENPALWFTELMTEFESKYVGAMFPGVHDFIRVMLAAWHVFIIDSDPAAPDPRDIESMIAAFFGRAFEIGAFAPIHHDRVIDCLAGDASMLMASTDGDKDWFGTYVCGHEAFFLCPSGPLKKMLDGCLDRVVASFLV